MLLAMLGDPIWQVLTLILTLAVPLLIVAVRTRDVRASTHRMRRDALSILQVGLALFLLMSAVELALHRPLALPQRTSRSASQHVPSLMPPPAPMLTPTSMPPPTPTPLLTHSITHVLVTFCEAINARDYQTAWNQYARSLQQRHPEAETVAVWRTFTRCTIPDQSADPDAFSILTLTFAPGSHDRFGRTGDVDYRFTMGVEDHAWKITGICDILSEGCFAVSWG